eukprot:scaffold26_cov159-Ochromonas_danica.AAC.16
MDFTGRANPIRKQINLNKHMIAAAFICAQAKQVITRGQAMQTIGDVATRDLSNYTMTSQSPLL